jgi:Caspase domain
MTAPLVRRIHAAMIAAALLAAVLALLLGGKGSADAPRSSGRQARAIAAPVVARPEAPLAPPGPMVIVDGRGRRVSAAGSIAASTKFRDLYPAQQGAKKTSGVPATNYWGLLIGINDYAGSTRDNIGSYQDARDLRKYLTSLGWRSDHIVLLTNRNATASMILQSIRWLASKTDGSSTVVVNYAGHEKPVHSSSDGDSESRDIALWASDNRLILDGTLGKELGRVRAQRMWINMAVCRAAGFDDPGMVKSGRVLTYASRESELAYEDPAVHHTVFGWYEVNEGMVQGNADANRDGKVSVEEAFKYAKPLATKRSSKRQHPSMVDRLSGNLYLRPPKPPPPPPAQQQPPASNCIVFICTPRED